ncbi:MAG TPA: YidB family protein [Devosia sp.]|nr:YidB family protein [Devosia sp.]
MANKGMPSMLALLGLLAVAGYQNKDKLGELLGGLGNGQAGAGGNGPLGTGQGGTTPAQTGAAPGTGGLEGMLGGLGGMLGGAAGAGGLGSVLSGGLGDLVDRFNNSGQGAKADSWVRDGDNEEIDAASLEQTLGADTIDSLTRQTGLSRQELLERLSKVLPDAVNQLTPNGRIPTEQEANPLR